eukprot:m.120945 g.120945  ORF g.120945 m.120945 type:complete len:386 (-) comp28844_c0_seq1:9-1166(-)
MLSAHIMMLMVLCLDLLSIAAALNCDTNAEISGESHCLCKPTSACVGTKCARTLMSTAAADVDNRYDSPTVTGYNPAHCPDCVCANTAATGSEHSSVHDKVRVCYDTNCYPLFDLPTELVRYGQGNPLPLITSTDPMHTTECCSSCASVDSCSNSRNEEVIFAKFFLPELLKNEREGRRLFVEIGGNDGIHASNTLFLERCLEWRGILIEAHPLNAKRLHSNRPSSVTVETAACSKPSFVNFSVTATPGSHIGSEGVLVPCIPLGDLFAAIGVTAIDFFSLDVEGYELQVLEGINWEKLNISVLVVEELQFTEENEKNRRVREKLVQAGLSYVFTQCWKELACDSYFANPTHVTNIKAIADRAPELPAGTRTLFSREDRACRVAQ